MGIVFTAEIRRKLHRVFRGMHERCEYPKHKSYAYYGGRGISVSPEWATFDPFYEWAKNSGYRPGLTLDREKNHLGYSPSNCRWATRKQQMNNTRSVVTVEHAGESKCLSDWEQESAVSSATLSRRLARGHNPAEVITVPAYMLPAKNGKTCRRFLTAFGERKTIAEWTEDERCVVCYSALLFRLGGGWESERALTQPSGEGDRGGQKFTAFGETKTFSDWAKDVRCAVKRSTLCRRLYVYGYDAERALTEPPRVYQKSTGPRAANYLTSE